MALPSNACHDTFPDNTSSNYTITLSQPIELQGPYEVALAEIMYRHAWNNIVSTEEYFDLIEHDCPHNPLVYLKILTGNYTSVNLLVRKMNALFKTLKIDLFFFVFLQFYKQKGFYIRKRGIPTADRPSSKYPCDINGGQYNFFVYTNIVEAQHVGDYIVPLLRIIKKLGSYGDLVTLTYNHMHYIPVNKQCVQDIQFELKTDLNTPVRFTYGKTICKLHLRPISKTFI